MYLIGENILEKSNIITLPSFTFVNPTQEEFYYCHKRNQGFSGGYGNGKSFGGSMKAMTLLTTFPKYRIAISRYTSSDLNKSTMSTFFKICPPDLYNEAYGGRRNDRDGYLRLINGSEVFWIHLDDYSEESLRGLEINSHMGDQMEEVAEGIYITIDSRIERWDQVEIPPHLNPDLFAKNPYSGRPMPPCYNMALVNPDTTVHWFYRRFHPDSEESYMYQTTHAYFSASTHDNPAIPESLKAAMRSREQSWVDRFYWGKWGTATGGIHYIYKQSILELNTGLANLNRDTVKINRTELDKLLEVIKRDGTKYRVMDHGEAAPTTCLWFAYLSRTILQRNYGINSKGIHVCYREYYQPDKLISYHREAISTMSKGEKYVANYADPAIFKKTSQKHGGWWTVADEYLDSRIKSPPIIWIPADNNEMATRNAVSEMLQLDPEVISPFDTGNPSPLMYFIKRTPEYPQGCSRVISETQSARHKKIGHDNGKDIYSDERDPNVPDHAYDPLRYYSVMPKSTEPQELPSEIPQFSFARHKKLGRYRSYGGRIYGR